MSVICTVDSGLALIELAAPPVNALGWAVRDALAKALDAIAANPGVDAVILAGRGGGFCAGGDLRESGTVDALREPALSRHLLPRIEQAGKPVIAAIHGFALGGGLELALACHARIACRDAQVGLPEARRGLIALSGTQRLPRILPLGQAMRMVVDGITTSAEAFRDSGLFDHVVSDDPVGAARSLALAWRAGAASPAPLLRDRPLQFADLDAALCLLAERRRRLRIEGATAGVDPLAAMAGLHAVQAAVVGNDFESGLAVADRLHRAMQMRRARRAGRHDRRMPANRRVAR